MGAGHSHAHGHHHHHHHHGTSRSANRRRLKIVLVLVLLYMVAEVVGGLLTNSLALLADAGHMMSDAASLALSLFAIWIAARPPTPQRTYGYYRTEILAALANGATLVAIAIFIIYEAIQRIGRPPEVQGELMMFIAVGGLVVNLVGLGVLHAGKDESLNVRGAWLHVLSDALGSVGAIAAGALIWAFGWEWADPLASLAIAVLVLYSSWALLKETVGVLMEHAPAHIDVDQVRDTMIGVAGVRAVHDLHVWTITSGMISLSAHVEVADTREHFALLAQLRDLLHERFGIDHITIQIEPAEFDRQALPV
jgi:cobalt-zinc-cadmium efflux system protein